MNGLIFLTSNKLKTLIINNKLMFLLIFNINFLGVYAQNIALLKDTEQSSFYTSSTNSEKAVDGNRSGDRGADDSITHTSSDDNPWWVVDLGGTFNITRINVYNRTDCCSNRLAGAEVRIGNVNSHVAEDYTLVDTLTDIESKSITVNNIEGRYVFITIPGTNRLLSLAEVEVYGTAVGSSTSSVWNTSGGDINYTDGNVGIGTTTPNAKLNIVNSKTIGWTNLANSSLLIGSPSSGIGIDQNEIAANGQNLHFGTLSEHNIVFRTNGANNRMVIDGTTGNIGIGTGTPASKLNIVNSKTIGWTNLANSSLLIGSPSSGIGIDQNEIAANGQNLHFGTISEHNIVFRTNGTNNRMVIDGTTGNVGIGTSDTKGFKLGVNGKIAATEVKVAEYNNWPDYVFENDYSLPTLNEVENHIQEKGHLKDIPSAAEVAINGILLGDMNAKLLQKIEELTLYAIAQEKEIKDLQSIKAKNKELEMRLAKLETLLVK